jgi:hypothetical protein
MVDASMTVVGVGAVKSVLRRILEPVTVTSCNVVDAAVASGGGASCPRTLYEVPMSTKARAAEAVESQTIRWRVPDIVLLPLFCFSSDS